MPTATSRRATITVLATLLADQATKWAVLQAFVPGSSYPLLPPILYLTHVQNTGAAFGLFRGMTIALIILSCVVAIWIASELRALGSKAAPHGEVWKLWPLSLILGGAIGNLIDRIVRGHVVDFLDLRWWPVFNVADSAITIGVIWLLMPLVLRRKQPR